jgi:long-subunit fatty acid transport protein
MKKFTISLMSLLLVVNLAFAGGLVTNTNQSAAWSRMLVRDASTSIDAVYYNPAGLTKLEDGMYISFSNQSIFEDLTITNSFPYLNNKTFTGTVSAPVFPDLYFAYKHKRWAFSFGFTVIGGGGSADFSKGIPSAEVPISSLVGAFSSLGVTGYSVDMSVTGSSVYYGFQVGASYAISDHVSVYAGVRYVMARNSYTGHIRDIKLKTANGEIPAKDFMNGVGKKLQVGSAKAASASQLYSAAGAGLQPLLDKGAGGLTIQQALSAGYITQDQANQMTGALLQLGLSQDQVNAMNFSQIQATYYGASTKFASMAKEFAQQAAQIFAGAKLMGDQDIDVSQSGNGFTPILGVNLSFMDDNLNFGIKYEFKTKMTLTNSTPKGKGFIIGMKPDGTPIEMFPDGGKENADMPAMLSVGAKINLSKVVTLHGGFHTYWDGNTGWKDVKTNINKNFQEYALGAEFHVSKQFLLSCGYLYALTGVNPSYQTDFSYSLTTNTVGAGGAWKLNDALTLQFGGYVVSYQSQSVPGTADVGGSAVGYTTKYEKSLWGISVGLDYKIGGNKKK